MGVWGIGELGYWAGGAFGVIGGEKASGMVFGSFYTKAGGSKAGSCLLAVVEALASEKRDGISTGTK